MRKQLDVLMGANRNGDVREVNRKYYDRDVCHLFLAGLFSSKSPKNLSYKQTLASSWIVVWESSGTNELGNSSLVVNQAEFYADEEPLLNEGEDNTAE
ncbi:hypothetical protein Q3G72_034071 [Acer saccharum]|nr:hypothetical protein Q3G72_034071 [Acer saccharum]